MTPPPTGTSAFATLGFALPLVLGASLADADDAAEDEAAEDEAAEDEAAEDEAEEGALLGGALALPEEQAASAMLPPPARATTPTARNTVRRLVSGARENACGSGTGKLGSGELGIETSMSWTL